MFGSDVLEVAISMVFLFLFMSTLASALREAIEAYFQHRSQDLERGLVEMLRTGDCKTWVKDFYKHPLISSLYKGDYGKDALLPAYIPKQSFSMAILDLAANASAKGELLTITNLKEGLKGEKPNEVQRVVLNALSAAGDDLEGIRKHLENWYDGTMDRVTGWYTRRSAKILFVIGIAAAALLNVDTITITGSLLVDRPLRQAIVAQAEDYAHRNTAKPMDQPAAGAAGDERASPTSQSGDAPSGQKKSFDELRGEFAAIGYPIGWTWQGAWPYPAPQACTHEGGALQCGKDWGSYLKAWTIAIIGWLITAIAIMLGAPFWFDLLNKLVSLRSALKPPENKPAKAEMGVSDPKAPNPPKMEKNPV